MRIPLLRPCLLALACAVVLPAAARKGPLPFSAAVEVSTASKVGETTLREDVAAAVAAELRGRGCLASVQPSGRSGADLLVHVRVETLQTETVYDTSLAQSVSPDAPPDVRDSRTARWRATLLVELAQLPGETRFAQRKLTVEVRRAPRMAGEDVERAAREEAVEQVGERVATVVCKAAAKAPPR